MRESLNTSRARINDPLPLGLMDAVIALDGIARGIERPELDDDVGEQLSDCNPPLPCLLAVFADGDSIAGCFDEEAQGMMEVERSPISSSLSTPPTWRAFSVLSTCSEWPAKPLRQQAASST